MIRRDMLFAYVEQVQELLMVAVALRVWLGTTILIAFTRTKKEMDSDEDEDNLERIILSTAENVDDDEWLNPSSNRTKEAQQASSCQHLRHKGEEAKECL